MRTYICLGCGAAFDTPVPVWQEREGTEGMIRPGTVRLLSPCCREPYTYAATCASCGAAIAPDRSRHGICPACARRTVRRLYQILGEAFSPEEREVLNEEFDGVPLTLPQERRNGHE